MSLKTTACDTSLIFDWKALGADLHEMQMKRWKVTLVLALALPILAIGALVVGVTLHDKRTSDEPFDRSVWLAEKGVEGEGMHRFRMRHEVEAMPWPGKSEKEVVEILGSPDRKITAKSEVRSWLNDSLPPELPSDVQEIWAYDMGSYAEILANELWSYRLDVALANDRVLAVWDEPY